MAGTSAADAVIIPSVTDHRIENCTAMHKSYPHGVGRPNARDHVARAGDRPVTNFYRNTALYNANTKSDRDHDGIACDAR